MALWIIVIILVIVFFPILLSVGIMALPFLLFCVVIFVLLAIWEKIDEKFHFAEKWKGRKTYKKDKQENAEKISDLASYIESDEEAKKLFMALSSFSWDCTPSKLMEKTNIDQNKYDRIISQLKKLNAITIESPQNSEPQVKYTELAKVYYSSLREKLPM